MIEGTVVESTVRRVDGFVRRLAVALACGLVASACSVGETTTVSGELDGIGRLPGYDFWAPVSLPDGVRLELPMPEGGPLGPQVDGNRVLIIGDSIIASTAKRYGNEMCETLSPLGWQVAVEAEPGRFAEFGVRVLEARRSAGWDVVVIYLGTNYDGNATVLRRNFDKMFELTRGTLTMVLTTGEFREAQEKVNQVIVAAAAEHDHVRVLGWSPIMAIRGVTIRDRVHLTPTGRAVLAQSIGRALDYAPYREAACLDSRFRDDTAITSQP